MPDIYQILGWLLDFLRNMIHVKKNTVSYNSEKEFYTSRKNVMQLFIQEEKKVGMASFCGVYYGR